MPRKNDNEALPEKKGEMDMEKSPFSTSFQVY